MKKALVDIETRKVPAPPGFVMPNGEPMRRRWQVFLVGVSVGGRDWILEGGSEVELLRKVADLLELEGVEEIVYMATREFDEMILKGRFTNARRAHLHEPGPWPALPGADRYVWTCLNPKKVERDERGPDDVPSKEIPERWAKGERDLVRLHLAADLLELRRIAVE